MERTRHAPTPVPSPHRFPRSARAGLARSIALAIATTLPLACAIPGRPTPILPELHGEIFGATTTDDARLRLIVMHRETPSLHARREIAVDPDGHFRFEPILLEVAGREFSKHYRVYLHLRSGDVDRVIWRADLSRLEAPRPIPLACDLARPAPLGEVCRVRDPLRQPWLLSEGARSFERLCADCHGRDGRGPATGSADTLAGAPPPDLTRIATRAGGRFDPDRVAAWIEGRSLSPGHARGDMPVWGERLSTEFSRYAEGDELIGATLDPIVAHLERLQQAGEGSGRAPSD